MNEIKPEWIAEYFLGGKDEKQYPDGAMLTSCGSIYITGYIESEHLADFLNEKARGVRVTMKFINDCVTDLGSEAIGYTVILRSFLVWMLERSGVEIAKEEG